MTTRRANPERAVKAEKGEKRPARATSAARASEAVDDAELARGRKPVDMSFLESLIGYNARRAALSIIEVFLERMSVYGLRPVDFSVLSLVAHNPGITSRQLCATLGILPPNLVRLVADLDGRGLIVRKPHPRDGRAIGLHLTPEGKKLMRDAEATVRDLEDTAASRLTASERETLMTLLRKMYKP